MSRAKGKLVEMIKDVSPQLAFFLRKRFLFFLLLFAAFLRLFYILTLEDRAHFFDTAHYDNAACALLANGNFGPSLHYYDAYTFYCLEPIYPIFLAAIYGIFGHSFVAVRVAHALLSLIQLIILFKMTKLLRPKAAIYTLLFGAVYPFFIYISGLLYITQLFALLLTLAFYFFLKYSTSLSKRMLLLAAVSLGIAIVARPDALLMPLFLAAWIFFFTDMSLVKKIVHISLVFFFVLLALAPWTIRNWLVFHVISPGRACLAETRIFEKVDLEFRIEDSKKLTSFPTKSFKVQVIDTLEVPIFECFADEQLIARLKVNEPFERPASSFYGLIYKGGSPMYVERLQIGQGSETLLDSRDAGKMSSSPDVLTRPDGIELKGSASGWRHTAIFGTSVSANTFVLSYPATIKPEDVSRVAILFNLDGVGATANGYMIWLHPWMQADLWKIENGQPAQPVVTIDLFLKENPMSVKKLILDDPVRFFAKHMFPEFLNFWSPLIRRVTTYDNISFTLNALSVVFFTPLLVFFIFGAVVLRKQWKFTLILLIPIITISGFYSVFFTELRYRIPIDGFLIVLAAVGFENAIRLVKKGH